MKNNQTKKIIILSFSALFLTFLLLFFYQTVKADTLSITQCGCYCTGGLSKNKGFNVIGSDEEQANNNCNFSCITKFGSTGGETSSCETFDQEPNSECKEGESCGNGLECKSGFCIPIGCTTDNDCPASQYGDFICAGSPGACVEKTKSECQDDAHCPEGQQCSLGKCIGGKEEQQTELGCTQNSDCVAGQACKEGKCVTKNGPQECTSDGNCAQGETCAQSLAGKVCQKSCAGSKCPANYKCGPASVCILNSCGSDSQCENGWKCSKSGSCAPPEPSAGTQTPSGQYIAAGKVDLKNPLGDINFLNLVGKRIIPGLLGVIGAVAVVAIIWGGFSYVISRGEEKTVEEAKHTITYAIIGLIFALLSYIIINTIVATLGG